MASIPTVMLEPAPGHRLVTDLLPGCAPAYVYLHGFGASRNGEQSSVVFEHAQAGGRAAARFDFRGHGASSGTLGVVTTSDLVADTITVLERTGPALLVGWSLGALIGAFAAAERPALVRGLLLLAPAFGYVAHMRQHMDAAGCLRTITGEAFLVEENVLADAAQHDEATLPQRLPMPVMVVHGAADEIVPAALSQRFFANLTHARTSGSCPQLVTPCAATCRTS